MTVMHCDTAVHLLELRQEGGYQNNSDAIYTKLAFSRSFSSEFGSTLCPLYILAAQAACFPFSPFAYASINLNDRVANQHIVANGMLLRA